MASTYRVVVFGKPGCPKCKVLNGRLDKMLAEERYADTEKSYCDLETEDGLVEFCEVECINPSRIPAMLVQRKDEQQEDWMSIPARPGDKAWDVCGASHLSSWSGLQTDYSQRGRGVLSGRMIEAVLREARGDEG